MCHQATEAAFIDNQMHVLDEIRGRGSAVAADAIEITRLDGVEDGLEISEPHVVDALGIDDGAVGENLEEHAELAAVIGATQGHSGDDRVGGGHRGADA